MLGTSVTVRHPSFVSFSLSFIFFCLLCVSPAQALTDKARLHDVKFLLNTLEQNYAYTWLKRVDWDALREKYIPLVRSHTTDQKHYELLTNILQELRDSHCLIINPTLPERFNPGFVINEIENKYIVSEVSVNSPAYRSGIRKGFELTRVQHQPVAQVLNDFQKHLMGSPQWIRAYSTDLLATVPGTSKKTYTPQTFTFFDQQRKEKDIFLSVPAGVELTERSFWRWESSRPLVQSTTLPGNVGYIKVTGFKHKKGQEPSVSSQFRNHLRGLSQRQTKGIVIDLRNTNGGYGDEVCRMASFFMPDQTLLRQTCHPKSRNCIVQNKSKLRLSMNYTTYPDLYMYGGPVVLLTNSYCRSACDMFSAAFKMTGRGRIIGQTTAGAGGTYSCARLPSKVPFCYTNWPVVLADGSLVEGVGISPDVPLRQTLKDLQRGQDTLLTAAKSHIEKQFRIAIELEKLNSRRQTFDDALFAEPARRQTSGYR